MAKRKPKGDRSPNQDEGAPARRVSHRVLAVDASPRARAELQHALGATGLSCDGAGSIAETREAIAARRYSIIVIDESQCDGSGLELVRELAGQDAAPRCIVTSSRNDFDGVVDVMRSGAIDFVAKPYRPAEIAARVLAAIEVVRKLRDSERRVQRLKRICKRLNSARREVAEQVDSLCSDLVSAYQELADQMSTATVASEFASIVRQELDVENLLRSTLEFLLRKTGPTNAAVFLPTAAHDFNLGAYVNYDVPRETADVLLDHLADVIAPRFEDLTEIRRLASREELADALGEGAAWLEDHTVLVFSCHSDGECLAVVALFRDHTKPFPDELVPVLEVIRDLFGKQLGRVIRIHHRHKPDLQWPGFDVEDDHGLAA
ncbi:MAG: response regulator [Planctomycetota bacterium]|nr:response regulator [Planctomycetota bacterium]